MTANELRIGNLVLNDNCVCQIQNINGNGFSYCTLKTKQCNPITAHYELIKPIQLTEEWLLKLGFLKIGSNFQKDWLLLHTHLTTNEIHFLLNEPYTNNTHKTRLLFVHQLQNLYFSLTGEELHFCNS